MKLRDLPILLSLIMTLLVIPLTLAAVKVNQDTRSQAMVQQITPTLPKFTPSPSPSPAP